MFFSFIPIGKDLYLIGGEKKGTGMRRDWYNYIWHYDSLDESWTIMTEMPTPRRHHSVAVSGQYIYVIGGFSLHRIIKDTVDRYDTIKGDYIYVCKLKVQK
jgi:N-acetylneuraminic acid mutarotase